MKRLFTLLLFVLSLPAFAGQTLTQQLQKLESHYQGRLGIALIASNPQDSFFYHADEHFPTGCTSKVIGVGAILKKSMTDENFLSQKVSYPKSALLKWSPITTQHQAEGMTITELAAAAISYSDNTAMNLLAVRIGGIEGFNTFARQLGDSEFKLVSLWSDEDNTNYHLSSTTPKAMADTVQKLVLGDALAEKERALLQKWMKKTVTGDKRIRAGTPKGWVVADKTGTVTRYGVTNDVAVLWPPRCQPMVLAVYFKHDSENSKTTQEVVAKATRLVIQNSAHNSICS